MGYKMVNQWFISGLSAGYHRVIRGFSKSVLNSKNVSNSKIVSNSKNVSKSKIVSN